jgi:DNA polymerase III subunit delta'
MNWHIHEQDWAVNLLRSHAVRDAQNVRGQLRHAYLFTGPEGVGRRTLAVRFAQALNCPFPPEQGGFCGVCRDCRQLQSLAHPDLSLLLPEEGHKDILIDQVRGLQHTLALSPYTAAYRIALLPDFQRSTDQAQNALLKTLEEPPDKVILLLTAHTPEQLLATIVSRCEVIRLRPASIASTQAYLQTEKGLTTEKARLLAHLSGGRVGAAIRLAEDPTALIHRREHLETLLELLPAQRVERFKLAASLVKPWDRARQNLGEVLPIWLSFWRDVFLLSAGGSQPLVNVDLAVQVEQAASQISSESARALVVAHEQALGQLDAYANVQLLAETLLLKWPLLTVSPIGDDTHGELDD